MPNSKVESTDARPASKGRSLHAGTNSYADILVSIAFGVAALAWFARAPFLSGFDALIGDSGDSRFAILILEHWRLALSGVASLMDLPIFYPFRGTLAFSDAYFAPALGYVPLRIMGLDPFLSYQIVFIGLLALGYLGSLLFLVRVLDVPLRTAGPIAVLFAFNSLLYEHRSHFQLYAFELLPWFGLIVANGFNGGSTTPAARLVWAGAGGLFLAALFLTSYYIAWMLLAVLLGLLVLGCLGLPPLKGPIRALFASRKSEALSFLTAFLIGLLPFFYIYEEPILTMAGRSYREAISYAPRITDWIYAGHDNLVWGWLYEVLPRRFFKQFGRGETAGLTPGLRAVALLVPLWWLARGAWACSDSTRRMALVLFAVSWALTLLTTRFGTVSLWYPVWQFVPGADGLRAINRMQFIAHAVTVLALALCIKHWWRGVGWRGRTLCSLLLVALAMEQQASGPYAKINRGDEIARFADLPEAPDHCSSVIWIPDPRVAQPGYAHNLDASFFAQAIGLPTVNGYSGIFPQGWNL